jgi:radical SAM protein with 4Fe4S-binding SPASM domain
MKSRPSATLAQRINSTASQKNIPLGVLIELTYRCNHRCYYCYQKSFTRSHDLSQRQWSRILAQLAQSGTLYLTISGGEPLLKKDFFGIVEHARGLKFGVSVITNGSLLDARAARRLLALGIMDIGISFHAASAPLHDLLSGVPGSFAKARRALDFCLALGVKTAIKHTVSSLNFGEFALLDKLSRSTGALFECDSFVVPAQADSVSSYALSQRKIREFLRKMRARPFSCSSERDTTARLHCDAGRSLAGIAPDGAVFPCAQLRIPFGNCASSSFKDVWNSPAAQKFRRQETSLSHECRVCSFRRSCSRCHGIALLESGKWRGKSPSLCLHAAVTEELAPG